VEYPLSVRLIFQFLQMCPTGIISITLFRAECEL